MISDVGKLRGEKSFGKAVNCSQETAQPLKLWHYCAGDVAESLACQSSHGLRIGPCDT